MSKSQSRLGKGLNAIVGNRAEPRPGSGSADLDSPVLDASQVLQLRVDRISVNPGQPRKTFNDASLEDLSRSIRDKGVLQPILVRPKSNGTFELVAGERRLRATKLAGLDLIPAVVRSLSEAESLECALVENLQREDLSPLERAAGYQRYLDMFQVNIETLANRLSESRASISNYLRLLRLRPEIHMMLGSGELGMGQARAIAGIQDPERQLAVARLAVRRNLSVRQVEALAQATRRGTEGTQPPPRETHDVGQQHLQDVAKVFSRSLGLQVKLRPGRRKNSGRVIIEYNSLEEFDRIAEKIEGRTSLE